MGTFAIRVFFLFHASKWMAIHVKQCDTVDGTNPAPVDMANLCESTISAKAPGILYG